jgi:hypothetical protein
MKWVSNLLLPTLMAVGAHAAESLPATAPNDAILPEWKRGAGLAQLYCGACHLFPEPDLLDKRTWVTGTLRKMAPYLGVAQIRYAGRPDGARLQTSGLFPSSPVVSEADWNAIRAYYLHEAPDTALPAPKRDPIQPALTHFEARVLQGTTPSALTTLARIDSVRQGILLGDAGTASVAAFSPAGQWLRNTPIQGAAVGLVADDRRTLVTLIGEVFPSDVPAGKVVVMPSRGDDDGAKVLLTGLQRPAETVVADLNGDGRNDLLVCGFGNYLGRLSWFEQTVEGGYNEHVLLDVPGAIRAVVRDVDRDGRLDLVVLMAQGNEGLFLFTNQGRGEFSVRPLLRFHPAFGSTGFEWVDMNGDGFPDVVLTNGDNGEYPSPFKRYHGVRIYLNDGNYNFTEAWFYPLNGAFKALARDFDGDGDLDLAVISFFPDYSQPLETGFVYLRRDGPMKFSAQTFPEATVGRWLTMDAGDVDGDGAVDLLLGAFSQGPPGIAIPAALQSNWQTNRVSGVLLRNTLRSVRKP